MREHGITQFMAHYARHAGIKKDQLMYGDEIEYGLFRLDAAARRPFLSLRGAEVRERGAPSSCCRVEPLDSRVLASRMLDSHRLDSLRTALNV